MRSRVLCPEFPCPARWRGDSTPSTRRCPRDAVKRRRGTRFTNHAQVSSADFMGRARVELEPLKNQRLRKWFPLSADSEGKKGLVERSRPASFLFLRQRARGAPPVAHIADAGRGREPHVVGRRSPATSN